MPGNDCLRTTSGTLNRTMYGLPFAPQLDQQEQIGNFRKWPTSAPDDSNRRAVYLLIKRSFRFPTLSTFDLPDSTTSCGQRDITTVPNQGLTMLNNRTVQEQADAFAARLARETDGSAGAIADLAWKYAYSRNITTAERGRVRAHFEAQMIRSGDLESAIESLCLALFNTNEFIYLP